MYLITPHPIKHYDYQEIYRNKKSISDIHGGFRIIFKLEGKSIFKQTFTFCVIN